MPHGNQSESECLLGGKIGKIGKIPGILRVYPEKPGYTRVIPALLHGFAPGTTPTAATTNENPAYHFRIPLYHTTPKLIKISPNTGLIPVKFEHWHNCIGSRVRIPQFDSAQKTQTGVVTGSKPTFVAFCYPPVPKPDASPHDPGMQFCDGVSFTLCHRCISGYATVA